MSEHVSDKEVEQSIHRCIEAESFVDRCQRFAYEIKRLRLLAKENRDTERLNRMLAEPYIVFEVDKYGKGALGNSCVSIETREDIDAVIKMEAERLCKKR